MSGYRRVNSQRSNPVQGLCRPVRDGIIPIRADTVRARKRNLAGSTVEMDGKVEERKPVPAGNSWTRDDRRYSDHTSPGRKKRTIFQATSTLRSH